MNITFDIETLPTTDPEVIAQFHAEATERKAEIKAPSNYKDETKIAEYIATKAAEIDGEISERIAKTSFDGMYGRIACIAWMFDDGQAIASEPSDSERMVLERLNDSISDYAKIEAYQRSVISYPVFCGHNIVGFDLPFIKHRSIILGVRPQVALHKAMLSKPLDSCIADTMLMWSSDPHKRGSMDRICRALGLQGKGDFNGSMVAATWPVDPQKVIEYCKDDVRRTRAMYKRMTFQFDEAIALPEAA